MFSLLLLIFSALALSGILLSLVAFLSLKSKKLKSLNSVFECGFSSWSETQAPFSLQFFLTALVFLIFDVELILVFPFLVLSLSTFWYSLKILLAFIGLLFLGLLYEWNLKALEWKD